MTIVEHTVTAKDSSWRALLWNSVPYGEGAGVGLETLIARFNKLSISGPPPAGTVVRLPVLEELLNSAGLPGDYATHMKLLLSARRFAVVHVAPQCKRITQASSSAESGPVARSTDWLGVHRMWRRVQSDQLVAQLERSLPSLQQRNPKAAGHLRRLADALRGWDDAGPCKRFEMIQSRSGNTLADLL